MAQEGLVNRPLVRAWLWWALIWLTVFPIVGVLVSIKFHNPEFLGSTSWLTFGRMRPVHVNGVIFGAFSTTFLGLAYYYVPSLCGGCLYKDEWGWWLLCFWNAFLFAGLLLLSFGDPPLLGQTRPPLVPNDCGRDQYAADHSGLGRDGEFLRNRVRALGFCSRRAGFR